MSDITLVDINELASTISKDKDMLFVVEVPSGGGYIQRKVTKEVMFQLLGNNLDYTTSPGSQDVITFDGPSGNKVLYINNGSTGVMIFKVGSLGVSADGATNIIQMGRDGTLRIGTGATNGTLQMRDSGQFYEYSGKDLKQNVVVDLDIQNAATTEAVECRNSIAYLEVDAGGTIASHTIQFPATAKVGYTFEFYVKGTITALTLEGGTATVDEALTTVTNGGGKWVKVVTGGGIGVASWRRVSTEVQGIPLTGTEVGSPVTGDIEILQGKFLIVNGNGSTSGNIIGIRAAMDHGSSIGSKVEVKSNYTQSGGGSGVVKLESSYGNKIISILVSGSHSQIRWLQTTEGSPITADANFKQLGIELESSNNPTYKGLYATAYHGANYDDNTYIQKKFITDGFEVTDGDIEITDPTKGIILTSPDSSRWRVTVDNTGTLVTTAL